MAIKYISTAFLTFTIVAGLAAEHLSQKVTEETGVSSRCWDYDAGLSPETGLVSDGQNLYFAAEGGRIASIETANGKSSWTADLGGRAISNVLVRELDVVAVTGAFDNSGRLNGSTLRSLSKATGIVNWSAPLTPSERYFLGATGSGIIAVSAEGSAGLFQPNGEDLIWKRPAAGKISAPPFVSEQNVIVSLASGKTQVLSTSDGTLRSNVSLAIPAVSQSVAGEKLLISGDGRGNLVANELSSGSREWKFKAGAGWNYIRDTKYGVAAISADNFVYMISPDRGSIVWKRRLPGRISGAPAFSDSFTVIAAYGENTAYVIELQTGRITNLVSLPEKSSFAESPILISDGSVAAVTNSGVTLWSFNGCGTNKKAALNVPPR